MESQGYLNCSDETASKIDTAVQELLDKTYEDAKSTLVNNRSLLDEIAEFLLAKETITGDELMAFINADKTKEEPVTEGE